MSVERVAEILPAKCAVRGVEFSSVEDFFDEAVLQRARLDWQGGLGRMVATLPDFDGCLGALHEPIGVIVEAALA